MKRQPTRHDTRHLVVLTGLSGSGKSTVLKSFEDMGFYCVDNLPVELMPIFAELHAAGEGDFARAALMIDAREGLQLQKLPPLLKHLRKDHPITLVFIEANDDALLRRYSETRRPHPLGKNFSVRESLRHERALMAPHSQTRRRGDRQHAIQRARAAALRYASVSKIRTSAR